MLNDLFIFGNHNSSKEVFICSSGWQEKRKRVSWCHQKSSGSWRQPELLYWSLNYQLVSVSAAPASRGGRLEKGQRRRRSVWADESQSPGARWRSAADRKCHKLPQKRRAEAAEVTICTFHQGTAGQLDHKTERRTRTCGDAAPVELTTRKSCTEKRP